jgi:hypothetical protein
MTDLSAFQPTHIVPDGGLGAWNQPDGAQPVAAWLQPGTEVRVEEWQGAWARAVFANGWQAWLDGRQLQPCQAPVPPPPPPPPPPPRTPPQPPAAPVWQPTNVVGPAGLPAWTNPDAAQQPAARIDPGVEVAVTERLDTGWANVSCSNGWTAWVDGRQLLPMTAGGPPVMGAPAAFAAAPAARPTAQRTAFGITVPTWWPSEIPFIAGAGSVLVIVGSFLPWLSIGPFSASGWDVSVGYLITGKGVLGGLKIGFVLLGALLIGLPALTHKPLPEWVVPTVGAVAVATAGITLLRGVTSSASLSPSFGLFLTLAAGIVILVDWGRERAAAT